MAVKCEHIKDNGEQCKRNAVWGLDPPRCPAHRLDGAATGTLTGTENVMLLSKYYYGGKDDKRLRAYRRDDPQTRLAKLFAQYHFLGQAKKTAEQEDNLKQLLRLTHLKTDIILQIVNEVEEFGHTFTDDALELAVLMITKIQAERDEVEKKLQERAAGSLKRSPGYWAVYKFVKQYISTYHISPTHKEIHKGAGLSHRTVVPHYLRQLQRDGFLEIKPNTPRGIRLLV